MPRADATQGGLPLVLTWRLLVAMCFAVTSAVSQAVGILIVQTTESHANEIDQERVLIQFLADQFDTDGRVNPIAWSLNDQVFRAAVNEKLVPNTDNPDQAAALAGAEKLRAEFVLIVSAFKKENDVFGRARLFRKGQLIWKDPDPGADPNAGDARMVTVTTNGGIDVSNSLRGAARTWSQLIFATPMKGLTPRPRIETPPIEPGVKPNIPDAPPPRKVDNRELMAEVMKLLAVSKTAEAIAMLRDAVDVEPLDAERRRALANALATSGLTESAASEARRAAELFPDQIDLRTQAARLWIAADQLEEANKDLNEAVARNPESTETRMLLGDVALAKLQVDAALTHFDFVIGKGPTGDAHLKRALARAMNDDVDGCKKDVEEATRLGIGRDPLEMRTQYATAIRVSQGALSEMAAAMRTLFQRARANFGAKEVREDQKSLAKRTGGLISLFGVLPVPPANKNSHGRRVLALKLLDQSLSELASYLDSGSDDTIGDATLTLGEALKALTAAEEAYRSESAKG